MDGNSLIITFFAAIFETVSGGWWFCLVVLIVDLALICGVFRYLKRRFPERDCDGENEGKVTDVGSGDKKPEDGARLFQHRIQEIYWHVPIPVQETDNCRRQTVSVTNFSFRRFNL